MGTILSLQPWTSLIVGYPLVHQVGNLQGVYHFELPDGMEEHSPGKTAALKEEATVSFRGWGVRGVLCGVSHCSLTPQVSFVEQQHYKQMAKKLHH